MRSIESIGSTAHIMNSHRTVDPLPQIGVLHGDFFAKAFPLPVADTPVFQTLSNSPRNLLAAGDQRDRRGLVECFEPPDDGKQLQTLARDIDFDIARFERIGRIGLEPKVPTTSL